MFGALGTPRGSSKKDLSFTVSCIGPRKYGQRGLCGSKLMRKETRKIDRIDIINPIVQQFKISHEVLHTHNSFFQEHSLQYLRGFPSPPSGFCLKVIFSMKTSLTSMAKTETFFLHPYYLLSLPTLVTFSLFLHRPHH